MNDDDKLAADNPSACEKEDKKSLQNAGLIIEPSLPDPLSYPGALLRGIEDFVPEDAWKSDNEGDAFKFERSPTFNGSLSAGSISPPGAPDAEPGVSIRAKSNLTPSTNDPPGVTKLVSAKTDYQLQLSVGTVVETSGPPKLKIQIVNIKGKDTSTTLGTFDKETGPKDAVSETSDGSFNYLIRNLNDVGRITEVSFRLEPLDPLNPNPEIDKFTFDISISKKKQDGLFEQLRSISLEDNKTAFGVLYSGKVTDSNPGDLNVFPSSYKVEEPTDTTVVSDGFVFFQKTYSSTAFEVNLKGFQIKQSISDMIRTVPSTFGLLARAGSPESGPGLAAPRESPLEQSFGLFVEPRKSVGPDITFTVYTRTNGGLKKNEFQVDSIKDSDELKITRENGVFKAFFKGVFIGEEVGGSLLDDQNQTNSFQLGAIAFAPLQLKIDDKLIQVSSEVRFTTNPKILLKDRQLAVIERYNLSLYYGRYGYGRTISSFTLLPGESNEIEITSSRSFAASVDASTTVFDSVDTSSLTALRESFQEEDSSAEEASNSFFFKGERTERPPFGGFFGGGTTRQRSGQRSSSSRSRFARTVAGAVSSQANAYSSVRTVEANTTTSNQVQGNNSTALKRKIQNLNNNRTLNFVFRQLNQEFISILHLVDIRLGFFGPNGEFRDTSIDGAKAFIGRYVQADEVSEVFKKFIRNVRFVDDFQKRRQDVLAKNVTSSAFDKPFKIINILPIKDEDTGGNDAEEEDTGGNDEDTADSHDDFGPSEEESTLVFDPDLEDSFEIAKHLDPIENIKGVIIRADRYVLRTEGVATEAIVGEGNALDEYGIELQDEDINKQKANTRILEAKSELLLLQKDIMNATDNESVRIKYLKYFNFLEDGVNARGDCDSLFWLWLKDAWTIPTFRVGIAFCFVILISFCFSYKFALHKL